LVWSYDATVLVPKGMDLPDLKAAREDAIRFCGEMLNHTTRLGELLKKKKEGKPIERPERPKPTNVVNLMDAVRQSVEASGAATSAKGKARAASPRSSSEKAEHPKPKRTRRSG
jgi:hypothetical protein